MRNHFGTTLSTVITLTRYYFHDLSSVTTEEFREREGGRAGEGESLPLSLSSLPVLMSDVDISFTLPLTDGSPLVGGVPPFLMIRNFP